MTAAKADIVARLQKDIILMQRGKAAVENTALDRMLGPIKDAFPNHSFPLGAIHEFVCTEAEDVSATGGFIAGIVASLMAAGGVCIWISSSRSIFLPALKAFGIEPDKIIFVDLNKEKDLLWVMEEALRCKGLAAVVGEVQELSFTASRRLQLAVEQSRVTGIVLRRRPRQLVPTACVSRWKITSLPAMPEDDLPGVGFPRWNAALLKVRNGKPGNWEVAWVEGQFRHTTIADSIPMKVGQKMEQYA